MNAKTTIKLLVAAMLCLPPFSLEARASHESDFRSYRKELLTSVRESRKNGRISAAEERAIKKLCKFAQDAEATHRPAGLNFWERISRRQLFEQLEHTLAVELDKSPRDDLAGSASRRLHNLSEAIDQGPHRKPLTAADRHALRSRLGSLGERYREALVSGLSTQEYAVLDGQIGDLERDCYEAISETARIKRIGPIDNRVYKIRVKIDQGVSDGRLTARDADLLNQEIARQRSLEDRWQSEDLYLRKWEQRTLVLLAKLLDRTVDFKLARTSGAPPERRARTAAASHSVQPATPRTPYRWYPSRHGGYFDATAQINGAIAAGDLNRYGGVMADGTPVMKKDSAKTDVAVKHGKARGVVD